MVIVLSYSLFGGEITKKSPNDQEFEEISLSLDEGALAAVVSRADSNDYCVILRMFNIL